MKTCGQCDHFGDYDKHIYGPWEKIPGSKFYRTPFLGFDEKGGALCARPGRTGTPVRTYDHAPACPYFKERTWTRPEACHDCKRKHGEMDNGAILCDGWPFYKKDDDAACQNGRAYYGDNMSLF